MRDNDTEDSTALVVLSGLLAAVALGQLTGGAGQSLSSAATAGGLLAIVTAAAVKTNWPPLRSAAEWCFALVAVIALLPAMLGLDGSACSGGLGRGAQFAVMTCFALTLLVVAARMVVLGGNWADLRYVGLGWIGLIEAIVFWSDPLPWTLFASDEAVLAVAIMAAIILGVILGWRPLVGLAIIGTALALPVLASVAEGGDSTCSSVDSQAAAVLLVSYLAVTAVAMVVGNLLFARR
ncbi:hypothetical protein [Gordonia alkanivorans]|uniref:hypothetical protein n=1 Tax=Gordonia alkanivorans TaxID=84096 RepID=UPI001F4DA6F2|nr:hypothetical protein [Gordonia alkanivorans]